MNISKSSSFQVLDCTIRDGGYINSWKFDKKLVSMVEKGDVEGVIGLDPFWVDEVKECGLRSVCTALGVVGEKKFKVLSYEGPYGVGYLVGSSL